MLQVEGQRRNFGGKGVKESEEDCNSDIRASVVVGIDSHTSDGWVDNRSGLVV